jgi:hypothetical protein
MRILILTLTERYHTFYFIRILVLFYMKAQILCVCVQVE